MLARITHRVQPHANTMRFDDAQFIGDPGITDAVCCDEVYQSVQSNAVEFLLFRLSLGGLVLDEGRLSPCEAPPPTQDLSRQRRKLPKHTEKRIQTRVARGIAQTAAPLAEDLPHPDWVKR